MLPSRRTLLDKRRSPLDAIRAAEHNPECFLLEAQPRVLVHRERGSESRLGLPERDCRLARKFLSKLARRAHQFRRRNHLVREPPIERSLRVEHLTGHDQFARLVVTNPMRQTLSPAKARNKPKIDFRLPKPRLVARDDQVACERKLESPAECESIDCRDNGNRQLLEPLHHAMP